MGEPLPVGLSERTPLPLGDGVLLDVNVMELVPLGVSERELVPLGERVGVDEPLEVEEPLLVRDRVGLGVQEAVLVTEGLAPGDRDGEALLVSDVVSVKTYTLRSNRCRSRWTTPCWTPPRATAPALYPGAAPRRCASRQASRSPRRRAGSPWPR